MNALDARHRHPWTPRDEAILVRAKRKGERHKIIARKLKRTPRSVDQHVSRLRDRGVLAQHRNEEIELLKKVRRESLQPDCGERQ